MNTIIAITVALIGLLGAWVGSLISKKASREVTETTHQNAIKLIHINNRKLAGIRLRDAFAPELAKLQHPYLEESPMIIPLPDMLWIAIERQQAIVNEFMFFLNGQELESFNEAWKEYYHARYKDQWKFRFPLTLRTMSDEDIQKAIDKINTILEFTKH